MATKRGVRDRLSFRLIVAMVVLIFSGPVHAVEFTFSKGAGILALEAGSPGDVALAADIMSAAATAGSIWGGIFGDPITIKLEIDASSSIGGIASSSGGASSFSYAATKAALIADATSSYDMMATSHLQPGPALKIWRNAGTHSGGPLLDADTTGPSAENNLTMWYTRSNAKALGLLPGSDGAAGADGKITLKTTTSWDPVYSDGIAPGTKDMVGTMLHEIGHHMGFTSGVDFVPLLLPPTPFDPPTTALDDVWQYSVLDLFRYSALSAGLPDPDVPDVSLPVPMTPPLRFISVDGDTPLMATAIALGGPSFVTAPAYLSTGDGLAGDGEQAGHWKDNILAADGLFRGLMDPTLGDGFPLTSMFLALLSAPSPGMDLVSFDIIGYTVPEPGSLAAMGLAGLLLRRRTRAARSQ